jgi:4-diphosphocytidyl-2-C-methyl-D-erythritol kinase
MIHFAPCKINLGLHVVERRDDGYHNIDTCFYPVPWCDAVEIIPSKLSITEFSQSGIPVPGEETDNLVMRSYELLSNDFSLPPIAIHLHKMIPIGAGLGGGSSNGASVLILLNSIFNLNLSTIQLQDYASRLGSDCTFFIEGKPKIGRQRGNVLEEVKVDLSGKYLVIIKPKVNVSTTEAYKSLNFVKARHDIRTVVEGDIVEWRNHLRNDIEESVFRKYPEIQ